MSAPRTQRLAAVLGGALVALVLAAGAAFGGYATTDALRAPDPTSSPARPPTAAAVAGAAASPAPAAGPMSRAPLPDPTAVATALRPLLAATALGPRVRAEVRDAATGRVLLRQGPTSGAAPASTAKILVAAAILTVHRATDRFTTRVVRGPGTAVTLVGGGDPTLTCAVAGRPGTYAGAARISDLAAQLRRAGVRPTRVVVDDSLFAGPAVSPYWAAEDVPSDYASPVTATLCDGGRDEPGDRIRSTAPDLAAGRALAAALGDPGLTVSRRTRPTTASTLAQVRSATVDRLITQMLAESDNVIAETLGRQVAIARGVPASFAGGVAAVRAVLSALGADPGAGMRDASGLAAADSLSAAALSSVLELISGDAHSRLHTILSAMPVAAWSGTLSDRYGSASTSRGDGLVRAKTGTLTGVSALAGVVHDADGRLLIFVALADRTSSTPVAEAALDRVATRLATCGCS